MKVVLRPTMLPREEYIEQEYLFQTLSERLPNNVALQELLEQVRDEVLATTKLPMALDFMLNELNHCGMMWSAMARLPHYFTPFQTYIIQESESERGRFDIRIAVDVLRHEAGYRAREAQPTGIFLYQFETLCRNRLRYDYGLQAIAGDPAFDEPWRQWILQVRRQIGIIDFADMLYVCSQYYEVQQARKQAVEAVPPRVVLFGQQEGKIALANRQKDPLYLFSALQRQLGYPQVPRPKPPDETAQLLPQALRRLERLETRLKLLEDEQRQGAIDLTKFYGQALKNQGGGSQRPQ